jgi:hypothetical protein
MNVPGNGDTWPDGCSRDPVPGLPPEWGEIVIPDDPAELAEEAAAVRRELALPAHPTRWAPTPHRAATTFAALRPIVLTMAVAVLTMLISLLVAAWPGAQRQPAAPRPTSAGGLASVTGGGSAGRSLPALELVDQRGEAVPLRSLLPAVIIVLDECTCAEEIRTVAGVTPASVTLAAVTIGRTVPQRVTTPGVRVLADPASELRGLLAAGGAHGTAQALLVARSGEIVRTLTVLENPDLYRNDLAELATS